MKSQSAQFDQDSAEWRARKAKEAAEEAEKAQEERQKRRETAKENAHERQFMEAHEEVAQARDRRTQRDTDSSQEFQSGAAGSFEAAHGPESDINDVAENLSNEAVETNQAELGAELKNAVEASPTAGFDAWLERAQAQDAKDQKAPELDKDQNRTQQHDIDVS